MYRERERCSSSRRPANSASIHPQYLGGHKTQIRDTRCQQEGRSRSNDTNVIQAAADRYHGICGRTVGIQASIEGGNTSHRNCTGSISVQSSIAVIEAQVKLLLKNVQNPITASTGPESKGHEVEAVPPEVRSAILVKAVGSRGTTSP